MTDQVFKYTLRLGANSIDMPDGAEILSVGIQEGQSVVWAPVTSENYTVFREILVAHTGVFLPDTVGRFLGTIQDNVDLVYHAFEVE